MGAVCIDLDDNGKQLGPVTGAWIISIMFQLRTKTNRTNISDNTNDRDLTGSDVKQSNDNIFDHASSFSTNQYSKYSPIEMNHCIIIKPLHSHI